MAKKADIFIDGACRGNPGPAGLGVVIKEKGKTVKEISSEIGSATNNIAEYMALIFGLQEALMLGIEYVNIFTDSELLYRQVSGQYKVKNSLLKLLVFQIRHLQKGFGYFRIQHIPREENRQADRLACEALKRGQTKMIAPMLDFGEESPSSVG